MPQAQDFKETSGIYVQANPIDLASKSVENPTSTN